MNLALHRARSLVQTLRAVVTAALAATLCVGAVASPAAASEAGPQAVLPVEQLRVQAVLRSVRFHVPKRLADAPVLLVALHGSGGDGARLRRLTDAAFDRLADEHGFIVAYPDAIGGQWHDCRATAPYRTALAGIDDVAFIDAVVQRATALAGGRLAAVAVVGYSNGGHMAFRLAFEAPQAFVAFAAIGAHLPVAAERDCREAGVPVPMLLVSGTDDPINPWDGGAVRLPGGGSPGQVMSAHATAAHFRALAGLHGTPVTDTHCDCDPDDGVRIRTHRWRSADGTEVALMVSDGGGHALPHPSAPFPAALVGRTGRDIDGAREIWAFVSRQLRPQ